MAGIAIAAAGAGFLGWGTNWQIGVAAFLFFVAFPFWKEWQG
jgi:hypothetical protein